MFVHKRNGERESVAFDKITIRIRRLCVGLDPQRIDPGMIAQKVVGGMYPGIKTTELDNLAAETAAYLTTTHPDYAVLAARIAISNLQKETKSRFSEVVEDLHRHSRQDGKRAPKVSQELYEIVMQNRERIDSAIDYERDYGYNYFGFKTLERSYLLKIGKQVAERPQHMIMRVALGIHGRDIDAAIETYELMSLRYFTHASPTLFHAGTPKPQLASCFLLGMRDDSIEGIYDTLKQCAVISKFAGGVGLHVHNIRCAGSPIEGTGGKSNGLVPMLRVFNATARYVDQGGNKRPGAFAIYLEPWHGDVFEFLDMKKNSGVEEGRGRDLFYSLWIPDLFMKRVETNDKWSLFCPTQAPGLADTYGAEFEELYVRYESEGRAIQTIRAQTLWYAILDSQVETGTPYMMYKDACNIKSNQKNLGTIKSSNLCTEILQYSSSEEVAVCNLASIALPTFVKNGVFDLVKLHEVVKVMTRNLNRVIDASYYPLEETRVSNTRHRPIGLGVQGLADAFILCRYPFDGDQARQLNVQIFETIYHAALESSNELAMRDGPYSSYEGSPVSQGILQFHMWGVAPSGLWDWDSLLARIKEHGVRNSLLVAPMPTASTSQILGFHECFEPYTSNIYTRRVLSGEFQVVNSCLLRDLMSLGLWNDEMRMLIIANDGSVANIDAIPEEIRTLYRTVWEIPQKSIIDMAADRGPFIDQSQSLNIYMRHPTPSRLTSMHFHGWRRGLKTGMYYLRTRAAVDAIKFTVDPKMVKQANEMGKRKAEVSECSIDDRENCTLCSG